MDAIENVARAACLAEGLDPDEKIFVQTIDHSPDAEPVIHGATGLIRGVNRPRWRSYIKPADQKGEP